MSEITRKDVVNLDVSIAQFLVPRLIVLKEEDDSIPVFDKIEYKKTGKQIELTRTDWQDILQEMIDGFNEKASKEDYEVDGNKVGRALELFAAYYSDLWI